MATTVKPGRKVGIDDRLAALRLQVVANELALRIGQRMRARRKELGLTQKQVAARMPKGDVGAPDVQRVSDWERGYNKPSDRYLSELVEALEVPDISYFYEAPEQPDVLDALAPAETNGNGESDVLARLAVIEQTLAQILKNQQEWLALIGVGPESENFLERAERTLGTAVGQLVNRLTAEADQRRQTPTESPDQSPPHAASGN